jgi:hypothetical protein
MVDITISGGSAIFDVEGLDKVWALKSRIQIPLEHISGATIDPEAARGWWHGLRLPGTNVPGVITAGTFYQHGRRVFFDVHDTDNTIVIALNHDGYDTLVVEVADPAREVQKIMTAIGSHHS